MVCSSRFKLFNPVKNDFGFAGQFTLYHNFDAVGQMWQIGYLNPVIQIPLMEHVTGGDQPGDVLDDKNNSELITMSRTFRKGYKSSGFKMNYFKFE